MMTHWQRRLFSEPRRRHHRVRCRIGRRSSVLSAPEGFLRSRLPPFSHFHSRLFHFLLHYRNWILTVAKWSQCTINLSSVTFVPGGGGAKFLTLSEFYCRVTWSFHHPPVNPAANFEGQSQRCCLFWCGKPKICYKMFLKSCYPVILLILLNPVWINVPPSHQQTYKVSGKYFMFFVLFAQYFSLKFSTLRSLPVTLWYNALNTCYKFCTDALKLSCRQLPRNTVELMLQHY